MESWPALSKWSQQYLTETLGNRKLSINLTPDGHGDCVKSIVLDEIAGAVPNSSNDDVSIEHFVYPAEHDMTMASFFELLEGRDANGAAVPGVVPYLSQQNDNLRQNMPELLQDIQQSLPLAVEAFSSATGGMESGELEAVNLWIGDERSVSSIHKDHFENMYAVVSGEKTFTLLPPTDVAFLEPYVGTYPTLRYAVKSPTNAESGEKVVPSLPPALELRNDNCPSESLEWLPLDPDHPDAEEQYPLLRQASPLRCTVRAGEVLYIPAMWYHRVSQTCLTVSVNYWYDQKFDFR
jgi:jumonji domain-containing protein 7